MDIKKISSNDLIKSIDTILEDHSDPVMVTSHGIPKAALINYETFSNLLSYINDLTPWVAGRTIDSDSQSFDNLATNIDLAARRLQQIEDDYLTLLLSIANAMDSNQSYLYGHNERVAIFSCEVAKQMNCSDDYIELIRLASILQNIGEIAIPTYVLQKKSDLEPGDWELIKNHPLVGAEILGKIKKLEPVVPIVYSHHEKFDGTGYPDGLKGEEIPLGSRIISIADTYDAITNVRLHRETGNHFEAIAEIRKYSGTNYDPRIVEIFASIF